MPVLADNCKTPFTSTEPSLNTDKLPTLTVLPSANTVLPPSKSTSFAAVKLPPKVLLPAKVVEPESLVVSATVTLPLIMDDLSAEVNSKVLVVKLAPALEVR